MAYTQGQYKEAIDALVTTLSLDKKNVQAKEYLQRARDALRINGRGDGRSQFALL